MKLRIIEHYDEETGRKKGYSIAYKSFPFVPFWQEFKTIYKSLEEVNSEICWIVHATGILEYKERYE